MRTIKTYVEDPGWCKGVRPPLGTSFLTTCKIYGK